MLRILHLAGEGADLEILSKLAAKTLNPRDKLSASNEMQVVETLQDLLETISAAYPTTLEEDQKRSAGEEKMSAGLRACLSHLISQKRIVRSNLERIRLLNQA
jgi:hypothetical protein